ncbi:MAG: hypothetical protein OEZ06_17035 [Myxococcales bacterium]|nr:hypothetical protein [Myxococcales bacterium]
MKSTRDWIEAERRRAERPTLDLALLTGAGLRYSLLRVSPIFGRALVRAAVHVAEVWFLSRAFPMQFLVPLLAMRALPPLVGGLHWGALEALRLRVRHEYGRGAAQAARAAIEGYLVLSGLSGALLFSVVLALLWRVEDPVLGPAGLYGAFALCCALALTLELTTRTYHSGIFALGRVYRPGWSMVAPDLLELAVIVGLFAHIGPFALHATLLSGSLLRASLALLYARRAYRSRRLPAPAFGRLGQLRRLGLTDLRQALLFSFATLPLQLDRLLLLALLQAPAATRGVLPLAMPYYALRPLAGFAQSWVRTFYADLVRLDRSAVGVLRRRLEALLATTALYAAGAASVTFAAGAYGLFGVAGIGAALWLSPLLLLRSRFALDQLRGFSYGNHRVLAATGLVLLLGLGLASRLRLDDRTLLIAVTALLMAAVTLGRRIESHAAERLEQLRLWLPLPAWLHSLSRQRAPLRLTAIAVDTRIASSGAALKSVIAALGEDEGNPARVGRLGRSQLLLWEPERRARSRLQWARILAGCASDVSQVDADDGMAAIAAGLEAGIFPGQLPEALGAPFEAPNPDALRRRAAELLPQVRSIDLASSCPELTNLDSSELAALRRAITDSARERRRGARKGAYRVGVYAPAGEVELVFLWPRGTDGGQQLLRELRQASWRGSIHG